MFEFANCEHLCAGKETIDELVTKHAGKNARVAADRLDFIGHNSLKQHGIKVVTGDSITEIARSIKSEDEIELMRWTIRVCEASMARV